MGQAPRTAAIAGTATVAALAGILAAMYFVPSAAPPAGPAGIASRRTPLSAAAPANPAATPLAASSAANHAPDRTSTPASTPGTFHAVRDSVVACRNPNSTNVVSDQVGNGADRQALAPIMQTGGCAMVGAGSEWHLVRVVGSFASMSPTAQGSAAPVWFRAEDLVDSQGRTPGHGSGSPDPQASRATTDAVQRGSGRGGAQAHGAR